MEIFHHNLLFATKSHLEYTLTIKQIDFFTPHSKQTPTKPSPIKVKIRLELELPQIERIPPLAPSDGKKAHIHWSEPHKLRQKDYEKTSIFVSFKAKKSTL
jgi:hypothetical protein